jgi:hypothetical protein
MNTSTLLHLFVSIAPSLIVYTIGFVFSLNSLYRYGKPAQMAAIAMGILASLCLGGPFVSLFISMNLQAFPVATTLWSVVVSCLHAGAVALLLTAVFTGRRNPFDE